MQLQTTVTPAKPASGEKVSYGGQVGNVKMSSGQTLKIESSPGGEEILNVAVPEGKRWSVYVQVKIQEFDA